MKTLIIMAVLTTFAFAGIAEFGVQAGYWHPTGNELEDMAGNFYLGGQFLYHLDILAIEASIGFSPLRLDDDIEDLLEIAGGEFSGHIVPITAGVRSYTSSFYAALGLEMDMLSAEFKYTADPSLNYDDSESKLGGYIGAGFVSPMGTTSDIDISLRLHLYNFETDQMWVGICAGLNF